jgi:hypothetical protein
VECTDTDHAGVPIFLTSDGVVRATATGTLSGYDWFGNHRFCPETGFLQAQGVVHSPQLGQPVSAHKEYDTLLPPYSPYTHRHSK